MMKERPEDISGQAGDHRPGMQAAQARNSPALRGRCAHIKATVTMTVGASPRAIRDSTATLHDARDSSSDAKW
jgi:hypothetical protein